MNAQYRTAIVVLCAGLSPAMAASAQAVPPFLDVFSYQYANCVQPAYRQADLLMQGSALPYRRRQGRGLRGRIAGTHGRFAAGRRLAALAVLSAA